MKKIALFCLTFFPLGIFAQSQIMNQWIYEIRDPKTDPYHFRAALEKIGEYLAVEVLEELKTKEVTIQTLTGAQAKHTLLEEIPVLITILRGGLPLNAGVEKIFPQAEIGFLGMSRDEKTLQAKVDYISLPDIKNREVILTDTMLATGGSLLNAIKIVEKFEPKKIYVIAAVASAPGIQLLTQYSPTIKIFAGVVDPSLNEKGYIIPGLGDAGDRSYGEKYVQ